MGHYEHLADTIREFYAEMGIVITLEPQGSRGPDLTGSGSQQIVGEIKHGLEIKRDVPTKFWNDWNSSTQSFGGKTTSYKLAEDLPDEVKALPGETRGWIAVIFGQMRYQARTAGMNGAWLVVEGQTYRSELLEALRFLTSRKLIKHGDLTDRNVLGFVRVQYL